MAALTQAQLEQKTKRDQRNEKIARGRSGASETLPPPPPATLKLMLGQGERVEIDGRPYELARFYMKDQERFYELIGPFEMVQMIALANAYDEATGEYDMERMASNLNNMLWVAAASNADLAAKLESGEVPTVTAESCAFAVNELLFKGPSEDARRRMAAVIALALSRRQPEITAEEIATILDLTDFLKVMRVIFSINWGIRDRF